MSSIYDTGGYVGLNPPYNGPGIWSLKANRLFNFATSTIPTFETYTVNVDSTSIAKPAGVVSGDLIFIAFVVYGTTGTISPPVDFTLVGQVSETGNSFTSAVAWKVAGVSEPSSYSWTPPGGGVFPSTFAARYSGVNTSNPVEYADATTSSGGAATRSFAEVIAAVDNSKFVAITFGGDGVMSGAPAGMETRINYSDVSRWFDETIPAGSSGTRSISQSPTDPYITISLALNPI